MFICGNDWTVSDVLLFYYSSFCNVPDTQCTEKSNLSPKIQAIIQHISQTENSELALALFGPFQFMKCFYPLQLAGTSHNPEEDTEKTRSSFSAKEKGLEKWSIVPG